MWRWKRACDQPPWSCRPGVSSVRSAICSSRPPRSASTRPCSRPTTATSAPSPRPTSGTSGREQEVVGDADRVGDRRRQREHAPDVVEPGREDREPVRAVAVELAVEVTARAARSRPSARPGPRAARSDASRRATSPPSRAASARASPSRRRSATIAGIEIEVEADRAAVLGPKGRELAQAVEADRGCRHTPFLPDRAGF